MFDLAEHLPAQRPARERWPFLAAAVLASYAILYLAHVRGTRWLRMMIWPVAPAGALWFWLTVDLKYKTTSWTGTMGFVFMAVAAATRWTFADHPPAYRPLPHHVPLQSIRDTTAFKAFNLVFTEARLIGLSDGPSYKPVGRSYLRAVPIHLFMALFYTLAIDVFTYPLYRLDPTNLGRPWSLGEPHDWHKGVATIAGKLGMWEWVVEVLMTLNYGYIVYLSMLCCWHFLAFVGIALGLYCDAEYPRLMDAPWRATSHNELWGRRYHQVMRSNFNLLTLPLAILPPSYRILRIFLGSAIYHQIIYYPFVGHFSYWPTFIQFMLPALYCSLERVYRNMTGKRVEGWAGRVWMYAGFIVAMYPGVVSNTEVGWVSALRNEICGENSILEQGLYLAGWGEKPVPNLARGW